MRVDKNDRRHTILLLLLTKSLRGFISEKAFEQNLLTFFSSHVEKPMPQGEKFCDSFLLQQLLAIEPELRIFRLPFHIILA